MARILGLMLGLSALLMVESRAAQPNYPETPIRIVVGFAHGAAVDILVRLLGQEFGEGFGKPCVIDNVTGAGGNIAADRVAKAVPDGYTRGLI